MIDASVGGGNIALLLHQKQLADKPVLTSVINISLYMYSKFTFLFCLHTRISLSLVVHVNKEWGRNWLL